MGEQNPHIRTVEWSGAEISVDGYADGEGHQRGLEMWERLQTATKEDDFLEVRECLKDIITFYTVDERISHEYLADFDTENLLEGAIKATPRLVCKKFDSLNLGKRF